MQDEDTRTAKNNGDPSSHQNNYRSSLEGVASHSLDDDPTCCPFLRRKWGWVVTFATYILQFTTVGFLNAFGILTVSIQNEFKSGVTATGWIPAIACSACLMSALLAEVILKKTTHRLVAVFGVVLCFVACVSTSFLQSVVPMYLTFGLLFGVGSGVCTFAGMILIVDYFPTKHKVRASALALTGTTSGLLVLNPVVYLMVSGVGWRNTLRIMGSFILGLGLAGSATFSHPKLKGSDTAPDSIYYHLDGCDDITAAERSVENKADFQTGLDVKSEQLIFQECNTHDTGSEKPCRTHHGLEIYTYPEFWMLFLGIISCETSLTFFLFYWVKFLLSMGFHESTAAMAMTVMGASEVMGKVILAIIGDHLPFPKIFVFHLVLVAGIGVLTCLLNTLSLVTMFVLSSVSGLVVVSALNVLPYVVSSQIYPTSGTIPMTTSMVAFGIGIILGTVYGSSMDETGSFNNALFGCMGAYSASFVLFSLVPLYQKYLAPERYVMWNMIRPICKRSVDSVFHRNDLTGLKFSCPQTIVDTSLC